MTLEEAIASIREMLKLEDDWDFDGAVAIPGHAVDLACEIVSFLDARGFEILWVTPTADSGVGIGLDGRQEVEVEHCGEVWYGTYLPEIATEEVTDNWQERLPVLLRSA